MADGRCASCFGETDRVALLMNNSGGGNIHICSHCFSSMKCDEPNTCGHCGVNEPASEKKVYRAGAPERPLCGECYTSLFRGAERGGRP